MKSFYAAGLLFIASVLVILIVVLVGSEAVDTSQGDSSVLPTFGESSAEQPSSQADTEESSQTTESSQAETEESSEVSQSYEERIGVYYKIDITPYLQYIAPQDESLYGVLVNNNNPLDKNYIPDNLVNVPTREGRTPEMLNFTAAKALEAFMAEALTYGVSNVTVTSGYRSYAKQDWLFNYYIDKYRNNFNTLEECIQYVMTFSMKAGFSEHQTGLTIDMHNQPEANVSFANTPEAIWLAQNAHRFGFIVRYPEDKTHITGISYEPWHFRFVGRETATFIYQNNLCLEEYYENIQN